MSYHSLYPWAKHDILHEFSIFTTPDRVEDFHHAQALCCYSTETQITIVPCTFLLGRLPELPE